MKIDLPTEDFYEEQISMKKKIVEKREKTCRSATNNSAIHGIKFPKRI